jgi:guanylate kinase
MGATAGRLFVISGPSGVGKGTVVRRLLSLRPDLVYSVSATTREARAGEVEAIHYRFVSPAEFERLVRDGALLEWAEVFGHRYGTPRAPIAEAMGAGRDVILEIDIQGARTIRRRVPHAVLVFLAPPSVEELARRLRARRSETDDALAHRLAAARKEMAERSWFDHVVVNDDVSVAAAEVAAIIDRTQALPPLRS